VEWNPKRVFPKHLYQWDPVLMTTYANSAALYSSPQFIASRQGLGWFSRVASAPGMLALADS
jgi:hypothetical protein